MSLTALETAPAPLRAEMKDRVKIKWENSAEAERAALVEKTSFLKKLRFAFPALAWKYSVEKSPDSHEVRKGVTVKHRVIDVMIRGTESSWAHAAKVELSGWDIKYYKFGKSEPERVYLASRNEPRLEHSFVSALLYYGQFGDNQHDDGIETLKAPGEDVKKWLEQCVLEPKTSSSSSE